MKKTQLKKFLFLFVVGLSLLFSYSSANVDIFLEGKTYLPHVYYCGATKKDITSSVSKDTFNPQEICTTVKTYLDNVSSDSSYSDSSFDSVANSYLNYFNDVLNYSLDGYLVCRYDNSSNYLFLFDSSQVDIIYGFDTSLHLFYSLLPDSDYIWIDLSNSSSSNSNIYYYNNTGTTGNNFAFACNVGGSTFSTHPFSSNLPVKNMSSLGYQASTTKYIIDWNGTYYYVPETKPEVEIPVFETDLTDDEIASVVSNFTNSIHWQNRDSAYNQFFIQHGETDGKYLLVLVSDYMYELVSGLYIPAEVSSVDYEAMDYDTYSILFNNGVSGTFFPWQTDRFNYKLYTSLDGVNFDYLRDMDCKDYKEYRWNMDTPVIYSSFYLPFKTLLGNTVNDFDVTVNDYSEEVDLKFSELVNSETGENHVFEGLDVKSNEETNPIIAKLSQFFKEMLEGFSGLFQILIDQIFNFSDFLLETYGENVVTLVFAILIKSVTVLVSSIALIFRAVGFILSLVAIPASSALLAVDVSVNTSGLVFSGLNWGTQFINGLNFVKSLSWNGLGLWTLFESFVSALEIILFVKIVRKHYSHTF